MSTYVGSWFDSIASHILETLHGEPQMVQMTQEELMGDHLDSGQLAEEEELDPWGDPVGGDVELMEYKSIDLGQSESFVFGSPERYEKTRCWKPCPTTPVRA